MKRIIKAIHLKDGKQIYYPNDTEMKLLWHDIEHVTIEECYTIEEWNNKFVIVRMDEEVEKARKVLFEAWKEHTGLFKNN